MPVLLWTTTPDRRSFKVVVRSEDTLAIVLTWN